MARPQTVSRSRDEAETGVAPRIGHAKVSPDTPSHTPGTRRAEEVVRQSPEKGRSKSKARTARSSTSINVGGHEPVDPRMPHLPPA